MQNEFYAVLFERKGVSRINGCRYRTLPKLAPEADWSKMEDRIRAVEIAINQKLHDLPREGSVRQQNCMQWLRRDKDWKVCRLMLLVR